MKTYTVLYAEDVPLYGLHAIEAENDQAALEAAIALHKRGDVSFNEAAWDSTVCARIVHIEDPDGTILERDKPLDDYVLRRSGDAAEESHMTMALRFIHGRDTPDEVIRGWGYDGPSVAGVAYVHAVYGTLSIGFDRVEAAQAAHALTGWAFCESAVLGVAPHEDLIKTKNMPNDSADFSYCGHWAIIAHRRESEKHDERRA
jgi:hypothetical protein